MDQWGTSSLASSLGAVVTDFTPLREPLQWLEDVKKSLPEDIPLIQVRLLKREKVLKGELRRENQNGRLPFISLSEPCWIYVGENLWFCQTNTQRVSVLHIAAAKGPETRHVSSPQNTSQTEKSFQPGIRTEAIFYIIKIHAYVCPCLGVG